MSFQIGDNIQFTSIQISCSVISNSLWSHGLQHDRLSWPWPTPRAYSNSCPSSRWCHPTIPSSVINSPLGFNLCQAQGLFKWVSTLHQVAKMPSFRFSISPSNEYSGLILFWMGWLDLFAVQVTLKILLQYHSWKASILLYSAFFIVQLLHPYMTTGKTIALTRRIFVDKGMSAF